ncbi:MAG: methyl-accepting chemotaxis protein [Bacillota bacterium]|nr:methyl-accepting chemotaxis protein [Bacillota bacterium]
MQWFKNAKIKVKLLACFMIVAVFTLVVGILGTVNMKNISSGGEAIYRNNLVAIRDLAQVEKNLLSNHEKFTQMVIQKNNSNLDELLQESDTMKAENDRLLAAYKSTNLSQDEKNEYPNFENNFTQYRTTRNQIADLLKQGKYEDAAIKLPELNSKVQGANDSIVKLMDINKGLADATNQKNINTYSSSSTMMTIIVVISTALAIIVGLLLASLISRQLNQLTEAARKLAEGDIDANVDLNSRDELGTLAESFRRMIETVKQQALVAESIADGNIAVNVQVKSSKDILNSKLKDMLATVNKLIEETNMLTAAALEGNLNTRGNSKLFKGAWADIVEGINKTLDAVIEPVKEAANVLEQMSEGNLSASVKGDYKGEHALIKNALNNTIMGVRDHIEEASRVLTEMSGGNLQVEVKGTYAGDFSAMKEATNTIIEALNRVLGDINGAAQQVASGSAQVSSSSQSLSQGATEQASAVEEITSSITELAAQTKENAVNANEANEVAETTKSDADNGKEKMQEMLKAMDEINKSSANISNIIKVIDEIAFQTNILALNAAVEAARAGQHGKGFAVVAEEVRNLAARSANVAKETTEMIEESIIKSEKGKEIANDTANALNKIIANISKVSKIVSEIAFASNEQAQGISQINEAIEQVSKVTQMNTATSEESASASEELSSQAIMLKDMVARFRLKNTSVHYVSGNKSFNKSTNKNNEYGKNMGFIITENTEPKPKISLDDNDFGKY